MIDGIIQKKLDQKYITKNTDGKQYLINFEEYNNNFGTKAECCIKAGNYHQNITIKGKNIIETTSNCNILNNTAYHQKSIILFSGYSNTINNNTYNNTIIGAGSNLNYNTTQSNSIYLLTNDGYILINSNALPTDNVNSNDFCGEPNWNGNYVLTYNNNDYIVRAREIQTIDPVYCKCFGTARNGDIHIGNNNGSIYLHAGLGVTGGLIDSANLQIHGDGRIYTIGSSKRFKENIETLIPEETEIEKLRVVTFNYKQGPVENYKFIGLIAEEVEQTGLQNAVRYGQDGQIGNVDYNSILMYMLAAYQNTLKKNKLLEERINILENRINDLCQKN